MNTKASSPRTEPRPVAEPATTAATILGGQVREILAPTDFSEASRAAVRYAAQFARRCGAALTLMSVADFYLADGLDLRLDYARLADEIKIQTGKRLLHWVDELGGAALKVDTVVRVGRPWKEITETARQRNTDLIILGTQGHTGLKHALFGSTAERVVRHAPCPVLVVRSTEAVPLKPIGNPQP